MARKPKAVPAPVSAEATEVASDASVLVHPVIPEEPTPETPVEPESDIPLSMVAVKS